MKYPKTEVAEARERLLKLLPKGATVYSVVRHVSRSGMSRDIDFYVIHEGELHWLTWSMARVLGYPMTKQGRDMKVGGCGMDMCFHVVHSLCYALWGVNAERTDRGGRGWEDRPGYQLRSETL